MPATIPAQIQHASPRDILTLLVYLKFRLPKYQEQNKFCSTEYLCNVKSRLCPELLVFPADVRSLVNSLLPLTLSLTMTLRERRGQITTMSMKHMEVRHLNFSLQLSLAVHGSEQGDFDGSINQLLLEALITIQIKKEKYKGKT